jgi:flavin-binding protein dodecin
MPAVKIIEILGISSDSWEGAANAALVEAQKTVRGITGMELTSQTAKVKDGKVTEYHATCKIAFTVE